MALRMTSKGMWPQSCESLTIVLGNNASRRCNVSKSDDFLRRWLPRFAGILMILEMNVCPVSLPELSSLQDLRPQMAVSKSHRECGFVVRCCKLCAAVPTGTPRVGSGDEPSFRIVSSREFKSLWIWRMSRSFASSPNGFSSSPAVKCSAQKAKIKTKVQRMGQTKPVVQVQKTTGVMTEMIASMIELVIVYGKGNLTLAN
mmetsp:Transcript_59309/g.157910  ORF Transcript_59309/g.157910 Transcript_59309/m.157910 type:complete len:201 (-) Transcript_59309:421-1023(-)